MSVKSDQQSRAFVAQHLRKGHEPTKEASGCLICSAWNWALSLSEYKENEIEALIESYRSVIEVQIE